MIAIKRGSSEHGDWFELTYDDMSADEYLIAKGTTPEMVYRSWHEADAAKRVAESAVLRYRQTERLIRAMETLAKEES